MSEVLHSLPVPDEGLRFRGHHFATLLHLEDTAPAIIAEEAIAIQRQNRGDDTSDTVDLTTLSESLKASMTSEESAVHDAKYAIDLIGDTPEQTEQYRQSLTEALSEWQNLPDEAPVIFDMKPDVICASCIFGQHCKRTNVDVDRDSIRTLRWVSEGLGLDDQVEISGDPEDDSLKLVTTAGVARAIMQLYKDADPNSPGKAFSMSRDTHFQPFLHAVIMNGADYPLHELPKDHIDPGGYSPGFTHGSRS